MFLDDEEQPPSDCPSDVEAGDGGFGGQTIDSAQRGLIQSLGNLLAVDQDIPNICFCEDDDNQSSVVIKLNCGHYFHQTCVTKWWHIYPSNHLKCPVCRQRGDQAKDLHEQHSIEV